ncbi:uncharacterized protein LOC108632592 [Ceratina calcarata]|uniref:Uncharacterized protein LOC108632592 n=1 Tax=Ceratina calcarata TaxID=156304 RepID=A0AAJ7JGN5_9HYME|nr:uncharacterized protein LOC108632592 [Ceratina calcarata]
MSLIIAIFSWNEAQRALKYYISSISSNNLELRISENQWQKLIKRVKKYGSGKCKNYMNRLILQQVKISENASDKSPTTLNTLIGGLECCWALILKSDVQIMGVKSIEIL